MIEPDLKIIDKLPEDRAEMLLQQACLLISDVKSPLISRSLSTEDKVIVSKLFKLLNVICKMPKKPLLEAVDKLERKNLLKTIMGELYFSRTVNNYQLIKIHFNNEQMPNDYGSRIVSSSTNNQICVKFQYRIEVALSSHKVKKILRPFVLLVFTMEDGNVRSFYVDVAQFQEIRKHVALALRNMHQIESKG